MSGLCAGGDEVQALWEGASAVIDLKTVKPGIVFQWAVVGFSICLMGLVILAIVLALFGVYG